MKKWLRTAAAVLLCLTAVTVSVPAAQDTTVFFMAVNENLLSLDSATMPVVVGGVQYVPYTMFSIASTGVNLNVYASYSSVKKQVLVYSTRKQLIFDLETWETYEPGGKTYSEKAIVRNSTVYIPLDRVCTLFSDEISYTVSSTAYGKLVRVRGRSSVLDDIQFINAADSMMRDYLALYQASLPTESPAVPTAPAQSLGSGAAAYLGFSLTGEALDSTLDALEQVDCQGVFFFTAEQLAQWDDLVRQLLGRGHFIGLRVSAGPERETSDVLAELERGRETLSLAAHCMSVTVLAEGADGDMTARLEEAGYVCWRTTADGRELEGSGSSRAKALMRKMTGGGKARNYVLLDERAGSVLEDLLRAVLQEEYQLRPPVAPEL